MTNAEKYLKEGEHTIRDMRRCFTEQREEFESIWHWLERDVTPELTEDERVILKNLRYEKGAYEYTKIGRTDLDSQGNCDLILIDSDDESVWWGEYGHLFQFIKARRRIRDKGVTKWR